MRNDAATIPAGRRTVRAHHRADTGAAINHRIPQKTGGGKMRKKIIWDQGGTRGRVDHTTHKTLLWIAIVLIAAATVLSLVYWRMI